MRVGVLTDPPDFSAYIVEILQTWGLVLCEHLKPDSLSSQDPEEVPVIVCPAETERRSRSKATSIIEYVQRGGTAVCFLPSGELAGAAGLKPLAIADDGLADGQRSYRGIPIVTTTAALGMDADALVISNTSYVHADRRWQQLTGHTSHPVHRWFKSPRQDSPSAALNDAERDLRWTAPAF